MNSEELSCMRHPNRLKVHREGGRIPEDPTKERAGRYHPPARPTAVAKGAHRKWMQNFSLHAGPPLWLLLKQI